MKETKSLLIKELSNIIFFWFFGVAFFLFYRILFIIIYFSEVDSESNIGKSLHETFLTGFRFDTMVTSYFILLPLILLPLFYKFNKLKIVKQIRMFLQKIFVVFSTLICLATINYYKEYHAQFDHFLFLGLYDDLNAVFKTFIIDFNPYLNLTAFAITIYISLKIFANLEDKNFISKKLILINKIIGNIFMVLIVLILFTFSIRGSIEKRPIMRKWAFVTEDDFLNKTIINPYKSLLYAIEDYNELRFASEKKFNNPKQYWSKKTVCANIEKYSKGAMIDKPQHIFLIVMESYDKWVLEKKFLHLGLSSNLASISKNSITFKNFIPSAESTINSISSIVTGIPYSGINQTSLSKINPTYCSSIFNQFEQLNYTTNFFYGGLFSWGDLGKLIDKQGVSKKYSAIKKGGKRENGIWGIEDEKLFDLVINTTSKKNYTFNIILTTSYHPPFTIDLKSKGFPYAKTLIEKNSKKYNSMSMKEMGHLWYSDKCVGDFIEKASKKFPNALFCLTGDHYSRRFVNPNPNLKQKSLVPFIIFGSEITDSICENPGSHIDIAPTIIEMIAPKGFKYYSFGKSLFDTNKQIAVGQKRTISKNNLEYYANNGKTISFDLNSLKQSTLIKPRNIEKYKKANSLGSHYMIKGDSL